MKRLGKRAFSDSLLVIPLETPDILVPRQDFRGFLLNRALRGHAKIKDPQVALHPAGHSGFEFRLINLHEHWIYVVS